MMGNAHPYLSLPFNCCCYCCTKKSLFCPISTTRTHCIPVSHVLRTKFLKDLKVFYIGIFCFFSHNQFFIQPTTHYVRAHPVSASCPARWCELSIPLSPCPLSPPVCSDLLLRTHWRQPRHRVSFAFTSLLRDNNTNTFYRGQGREKEWEKRGRGGCGWRLHTDDENERREAQVLR